MPRFTYEADTTAPPERVLAALTDFSDDRPKYWPTLDRRYYKVKSASASSAVVEEGSSMFGGFFGEEHYDWSTPGVVRATVAQSNIAEDGGIWEFRVSPGAGGGSHVSVLFDRKMKGLKGNLLSIFLSTAASKAFKANLMKTLKILESEAGSSTATGS
jgi:Polyketide cyclase / dehydrase and lipid transport